MICVSCATAADTKRQDLHCEDPGCTCQHYEEVKLKGVPNQGLPRMLVLQASGKKTIRVVAE